tara:strand:+ start:547 stop:783 length:237 start_codon:yes stop_codon:yes gene_type:complete
MSFDITGILESVMAEHQMLLEALEDIRDGHPAPKLRAQDCLEELGGRKESAEEVPKEVKKEGFDPQVGRCSPEDSKES